MFFLSYFISCITLMNIIWILIDHSQQLFSNQDNNIMMWIVVSKVTLLEYLFWRKKRSLLYIFLNVQLLSLCSINALHSLQYNLNTLHIYEAHVSFQWPLFSQVCSITTLVKTVEQLRLHWQLICRWTVFVSRTFSHR